MIRIAQYMRESFQHWFYAMMIVVLYALTQQADAKPIHTTSVEGMDFYKDSQTSNWTIVHKGVTTTTDERFEKLELVWRGAQYGRPLVLMVGKLPDCDYAYRLYYGMPSGDIQQANGFGNCKTATVGVTKKDDYLHLYFNGVRKSVPLK